MSIPINAPDDRGKIQVRNPATGETIAELRAATKQEVVEAVDRARKAQATWQETSFAERAKIFRRFRDLVVDHKEKVADILTSESGKPRSEVFVIELFYLCDAIGFWAKRGPGFLEPEKLRPHLFKVKKVVSTYGPHGVVGIISPWNFPLALTIGEALPALMAGNAVVVKPSDLTPLSARFGVELARQAGFPEGLLQAVVGYGETGGHLADEVDMISFTGSVETGKKVLRRAAERLIPVSLELGGKDPMIVLKDADLERAANGCVWGALMNSGQVCTSIERVYVEEPAYDSFVSKVVEKVKALRQGLPTEQVDLGSMTSSEQLAKVESQIAAALKQGARVLTGGARSGVKGLYLQPTVLVDVTHEMEIMKEETFGPVIPIMKVRDLDEAVRLANDSRYGLSGSVFSGDRNTASKAAEKIEAGAVCINDCLINYVIPEAPMGGIKQSGLGKRHGVEGIRKYCRQKSIVTDRLGLKSEMTWFPMSERKAGLFSRGLNLLFRSGWKNKFFSPKRT
ncbi:MAG: succinic semialdehyde dehydrogenase [Candidatus Binatia bacterium]